MMRCVVSVAVSEARLVLGVVDTAGRLVHTALAPTPPSPPELLGCVGDLIQSVIADYRPGAVGVAVPGLVDAETGVILDGGPAGWAGTAVAGELYARFGRPVAVDSDMRAAALGESWRGAGQGADPLLVVLVGSGLGAALVLGGRPYYGAHFGELAVGYEAVPNVPVGYLPNPYSAECNISQAGLRHRLGEAVAAGRRTLLDPRAFELRELFALAAHGDAVALDLQAGLFNALISVLTNLVYQFDPLRLLLGGEVIETGGPALFQTVHDGVVQRLTELRRPWFDLRPTSLGDMAAVFGAARLAADRLTW